MNLRRIYWLNVMQAYGRRYCAGFVLHGCQNRRDRTSEFLSFRHCGRRPSHVPNFSRQTLRHHTNVQLGNRGAFMNRGRSFDHNSLGRLRMTCRVSAAARHSLRIVRSTRTRIAPASSGPQRQRSFQVPTIPFCLMPRSSVEFPVIHLCLPVCIRSDTWCNFNLN